MKIADYGKAITSYIESPTTAQKLKSKESANLLAEVDFSGMSLPALKIYYERETGLPAPKDSRQLIIELKRLMKGLDEDGVATFSTGGRAHLAEGSEDIVEPPKSMQVDTTTKGLDLFTLQDFKDKAEIYVGAYHNNALPIADIKSALNKFTQKGIDDGTFTADEAIKVVQDFKSYFVDMAQKQRLRGVIPEGIGTVEREERAIGGGAFVGEDLGSREGFEKINYRRDPEIQNKVKTLFEEGKTNQQVADELKINKTTIKRIKKDLGLDTVKKTQLETIKQKYLKLKDLVEDTNKGFKYTQMKDLLEQVGLRGDYSPSDIKNMQKYNIPKLDSAQDKVRKAFKFLTSDPNKPVEELFGFNSKIAELTGTNQNQVSMILKDTPEYIDFKPIMNKLIIPSSRARITGKNMVLADLIEEVENVKRTGGGNILRSARNTPEYFIIESAKKHVNQGGTKVEFTRMPGNLDETGKLISTTDAEFIYKGKKYTYDDLLRAGRKNFPEVYKVFDDLDELLQKNVIHPVTKQKINFSTLMQEAYNKGAGYSYDRIPYAIDHFKQVKVEPFTDLRITSARLNSSAGVLKQKEFQATQGAFGEKKTKLYAPEKVKKNLKKMGYDFTKDINKLFDDELKLANDILVKKRVLKKPIQIAQDYEKLQFEKLKKIPGVTTADTIPRPEKALLSDKFKTAFTKGLKTTGKVIKPIGYAVGANALKTAITKAEEQGLDLNLMDKIIAFDSGDAEVALNNAKRRVDPEFAAAERAKDLAQMTDDFEEVGKSTFGKYNDQIKNIKLP